MTRFICLSDAWAIAVCLRVSGERCLFLANYDAEHDISEVDIAIR